MEEKYPWLKNIIENQENIMEQKQLTPIYTKLNFMLLTKKYDVINYLLENLDTTKSHEALLVVVLRITYKKRKHFPLWKEKFDETNKELEKREVNLKLEL